jgi:hypothetical protein
MTYDLSVLFGPKMITLYSHQLIFESQKQETPFQRKCTKMQKIYIYEFMPAKIKFVGWSFFSE